MTPKLWTFKVQGGEPFELQPQGNPRVKHNGSLSVFHLTLTESQAETIKAHMAGTLGCKVTAFPMDEETPDQAGERSALLGVGREETVYPSTACPSCFWFDPVAENYCGWVDWPKETRKEALVSHEAARKGIGDCPVH